MNQLDPHIEELIIAHLSGRTDRQEDKKLEAWLAESPANQTVMQRCKEIWQSIMIEHEAPRYDWTIGFSKFKQRVVESSKNQPTTHEIIENKENTQSDDMENTPTRNQRTLFLLRHAAILIIAIAITAVLCFKKANQVWTNQLADISMNVPFGSTMETSLPDGTKVILNGGTKLRYSQGYGIKSRCVMLSGEAYFDIVHKKTMPLEITMTRMTIHDIGTKLNITNYPEDPQAIITVDEGSVDIKTAYSPSPKRLFAGQQAVVNKSTGRVSINTKTSNGDAWNKGILVFRNNTVEEIAHRLERTYNVTITIHSEVTAHKRFYGTFSQQKQNIDDILRALKETGTLSYKIKGRSVDIY